VRVDVDEFERSVDEGLAALARGDAAAATDRFARALALYRGDFLSDDPYAEWAFAERERLRALVEKPLRGLAELALRAGDMEAAAGHMERLAELEPFDSEIQRQLLTLWLSLGRRSRAVRHFQSFQLRMLRGFGQGPDFHISDLHPEPGVLSLI
jgi:DNA-binding SARP family transcriptional activator